ncbi:hypothetical protein KXV86_004064, partial [Aspergillus fumigatus]
GKVLADTLVERTVSEGAAVAPEPDELDEQLVRSSIHTIVSLPSVAFYDSYY